MCTYNGSRFLGEQLASIAAQDYPDWRLVVSDDGSTDGTLGVLDKWPSPPHLPPVVVVHGPGKGFVANFLSFVTCPSVVAEYYAFADQDDIWETDKLSRAVAWLDTIDPSVPALYCSRTRLVDSDNQEIGLSPLFAKKPGFANALVQCIAGGNTMLFNEAARRLSAASGVTTEVVSHDWWLYLIVTGCGGRAHYDPYPTMRYRQHTGNLVGSNSGWRSRFDRVQQLFRGNFRAWSDRQVAALGKIESRLTPENRKLFRLYAFARQQSLLPRVAGLIRCGVYRQTLFSNLGLLAAAIFKKI